MGSYQMDNKDGTQQWQGFSSLSFGQIGFSESFRTKYPSNIFKRHLTDNALVALISSKTQFLVGVSYQEPCSWLKGFQKQCLIVFPHNVGHLVVWGKSLWETCGRRFSGLTQLLGVVLTLARPLVPELTCLMRFVSQQASLDVCGNEGPARAKACGVGSRKHLWSNWELSLAKPHGQKRP